MNEWVGERMNKLTNIRIV